MLPRPIRGRGQQNGRRNTIMPAAWVSFAKRNGPRPRSVQRPCHPRDFALWTRTWQIVISFLNHENRPPRTPASCYSAPLPPLPPPSSLLFRARRSLGTRPARWKNLRIPFAGPRVRPAFIDRAGFQGKRTVRESSRSRSIFFAFSRPEAGCNEWVSLARGNWVPRLGLGRTWLETLFVHGVRESIENVRFFPYIGYTGYINCFLSRTIQWWSTLWQNRVVFVSKLYQLCIIFFKFYNPLDLSIPIGIILIVFAFHDYITNNIAARLETNFEKVRLESSSISNFVQNSSSREEWEME